MSRAYEIAEILWSEGNAIGVIQRTPSKGYLVGRYFTDGRKPEILGASMVDWACAFFNACSSVDPETAKKIQEILLNE